MRRQGVQGEDSAWWLRDGESIRRCDAVVHERAESQAADAIDKVCEVSGAKPSCYAPPRDSGAGWAAVVENLVDTRTPLVYCPAPTTTTTIVTTTSTTTGAPTTTTTSTATTTTTMYGSPSRAFLAPAVDLLE